VERCSALELVPRMQDHRLDGARSAQGGFSTSQATHHGRPNMWTARIGAGEGRNSPSRHGELRPADQTNNSE